MAASSCGITVVIPTYRRGQVLLDTLRHLAALRPVAEILVVDQTESPAPEIEQALRGLEGAGAIRRFRRQPPGVVGALNFGLKAARGPVVLFLDDDIVPSEDLIGAHCRAYEQYPEAWAVVGRVLQPEDSGMAPAGGSAPRSGRGGLWRDLDFKFNGTGGDWVENVMAGNLSVRRDRALALGGFDERFVPPVSFRFETEFARRMVAAGGRIRFEPDASIRHLRAAHGGIRSIGGHMASLSPLHGVGDYYYALRCGRGWGRAWYMARRPFREVRTRFHLAHPWWIPVKFIGELRAMLLAARLFRAGPRFLDATAASRTSMAPEAVEPPGGSE